MASDRESDHASLGRRLARQSIALFQPANRKSVAETRFGDGEGTTGLCRNGRYSVPRRCGATGEATPWRPPGRLLGLRTLPPRDHFVKRHLTSSAHPLAAAPIDQSVDARFDFFKRANAFEKFTKRRRGASRYFAAVSFDS